MNSMYSMIIYIYNIYNMHIYIHVYLETWFDTGCLLIHLYITNASFLSHLHYCWVGSSQLEAWLHVVNFAHLYKMLQLILNSSTFLPCIYTIPTISEPSPLSTQKLSATQLHTPKIKQWPIYKEPFLIATMAHSISIFRVSAPPYQDSPLPHHLVILLTVFNVLL